MQGAWSVWWWIDGRGLLASSCSGNNCGEEEEEVSRVTFAVLPPASKAEPTQRFSEVFVDYPKCSATRPAERQNTHFPSSLIPISPLSYSLLSLMSFVHADISVHVNCLLYLMVLSTFSVIYLCWVRLYEVESVRLKSSPFCLNVDYSPEDKCFGRSPHVGCLSHMEYHGRLLLTWVSPSLSKFFFSSPAILIVPHF